MNYKVIYEEREVYYTESVVMLYTPKGMYLPLNASLDLG